MREKYEIKITSKGQLTLPKELREKLAISKGSELILELKKGEIALKPRRISIMNKLVGRGRTKSDSL